MTVKRVFISGPISKGDMVENLRRADDAMLALMKAGLAPFNPMLSCYAGGLECPDNRDQGVYGLASAHGGFRDLTHADWIAMDLAWVEVADAVLRLPGESTGADAECAHADECGVPVFHAVDAVVAAMAALTASEEATEADAQRRLSAYLAGLTDSPLCKV